MKNKVTNLFSDPAYPVDLDKSILPIYRPGMKDINTTNYSTRFSNSETGLIRFAEKKEFFIWAQPIDILFLKSADHYVKSLIRCGTQKKWAIRHGTIKDIIAILPNRDFIRLNRFYVLNLNHFSYLDEDKQMLYLNDGFSIPISHRVSPFLVDRLKF